MIREPLHQFDKGSAFYQRHPTVLLAFLKHDITRRVQLSKAVRTGIREPRNNNNCQKRTALLKFMYVPQWVLFLLVRQDYIQSSLQHGLCVQHD